MSRYRFSKQRKQKVEFSKIILASVAIVTLAITILCIILMFITQDLSPFAYLIPAIFAELAIGTGFYYKKAEKENIVKIKTAAKKAGISLDDGM